MYALYVYVRVCMNVRECICVCMSELCILPCAAKWKSDSRQWCQTTFETALDVFRESHRRVTLSTSMKHPTSTSFLTHSPHQSYCPHCACPSLGLSCPSSVETAATLGNLVHEIESDSCHIMDCVVMVSSIHPPFQPSTHTFSHPARGSPYRMSAKRGLVYMRTAADGCVIVISELLERHSKAKRTRTPAYSRALRRIKGVFQRVVHGKLRSDFQRVRKEYLVG